MSGYVICQVIHRKVTVHESYGYWRGETCRETFPITDIVVTQNTKVYKSKKKAVNSAEKNIC
ncbi:hypothetical protein COL93_01940 [Bacillus toyonensis]|uniref:Uncharacterized protein n=1 Tax=Bacillus toyonensis TaxID=155322 RepID=A0A2B5Y7L7_9BACI|nr:hypothetical protein COL93_01940 [Bacillus toyonensis]PHD74222.1 hypothetical protein COF40_02865 [Bacillus toyonensis]